MLLYYADKGDSNIVCMNDGMIALINEEYFKSNFKMFAENEKFTLTDETLNYDFIYDIIQNKDTLMHESIDIEKYDICIELDGMYLFLSNPNNLTTDEKYIDNLGLY